MTLIVDRVLRMRERAALMKKLNIVIGALFCEVGTKRPRHFIAFDEEAGAPAQRLLDRTNPFDPAAKVEVQ